METEDEELMMEGRVGTYHKATLADLEANERGVNAYKLCLVDIP